MARKLLNENPPGTVKLRAFPPYVSTSPCFQVCSKNMFAIGTYHGCREYFCSAYKRSLLRAAKDKYFMPFMLANTQGVLNTLLDKFEQSAKILNSLEKEYSLEKTEIRVYTGDKIERGPARPHGAPVMIVPVMDEIWTSAAPLLSLHALLMRLPQKVRIPKSIRTFDDFRKHVDANKHQLNGDITHARHHDKWLLVLDNLLEVFGDRPRVENWRYPGFSGIHGITQLVSQKSGGDPRVRAAWNALLEKESSKS